jgi:hypothetical protein
MTSSKRKMIPGIHRSLFEPIGEVTVNFAMLEHVLSGGTGLLLFGNNGQEQRTGQIVTAELSFRRNVELFSCLFRHRFPEKGDAGIKALCSKLLVLEEKRNVTIHSFWGGAGEPGYSTRIKVTAKLKGIAFQFQKTSREEIAAVANEIAEVASELQDFVFAIAFPAV